MDVGSKSAAGNLVSLAQNLWNLYQVSSPLLTRAIFPSPPPPTGLASFAQPMIRAAPNTLQTITEDTNKVCSDQITNGMTAVMTCCQQRVIDRLPPGDYCLTMANTLQQSQGVDIPDDLLSMAASVSGASVQSVGEPSSMLQAILGIFKQKRFASVPLPSTMQSVGNVNRQATPAEQQYFSNLFPTVTPQPIQRSQVTLRLGNITTQPVISQKQLPVLRLGSLGGQGSALGTFNSNPIQVSRPTALPSSVISVQDFMKMYNG